MGRYDFFESLQQLSTRKLHTTIQNYLHELEYTQKNQNSNDYILLGATRMAYILGLIDKTTASHYHRDSHYKVTINYDVSEYMYWDEYCEKHFKIVPLPITEIKTLPATKAKEMTETYILSLLDIMGKYDTSENLYYVIDGVTGFAVFLKLFDYNEMAKYCAKAYVKDGTNFKNY